MSESSALVWFRRDLRVQDHAALHHALGHHGRVHCVFVFDTEILDALPSREDRRVVFILDSLRELDRELGGRLLVRHGEARELIPRLARELGVQEVVCARDYEPEAIRRDGGVSKALADLGIGFTALRDQVIFDTDEVLTGAGRMFSVFTPYRNAWIKALAPWRLAPLDIEFAGRLAPKAPGERVPELEELGFRRTDLGVRPGASGARERWDAFRGKLDKYKESRDFPALDGTSGLSVHLRFGTVSVRELVRTALEKGTEGAQAWVNELIWREFYQQLLWHRPDVETHAFRAGYDRILWEEGPESEARFQAWCEGRTGYPLVDAAMRQLLSTGWMHNRLRMVTASFLTKDLGIHWLRGERFFARHLLDYDLASNNGGWQWAASTGCDAQPWFRIFNPTTQSQKFDPQGEFIRCYCPELAGLSARQIHLGGPGYPPPIVDHALERQRTLQRFKGMAGEGSECQRKAESSTDAWDEH